MSLTTKLAESVLSYFTRTAAHIFRKAFQHALRSVRRRSVRVRLSRLPLFRVPKRAPEQSGDFMLLPELAFSFMESQKCIELGQLSAA